VPKLLADGNCESWIVDLLCADQAQRWGAGQRVPAEAYLDMHPNRWDDANALALVCREFALREGLGEAPDAEEYLRRFPHLADGLRRQLEARRAAAPDRPDEPRDTVRQDAPFLVHRAEDHGSTLADQPLSAPAPAIPGYEILAEIGRGGMGAVFKARQVALKRLVALKVILGGSLAHPEDLRRFRYEAEAIAGLQHPNIVQVHEVGEHHGLAFLTLEYAGGGDLRGRLAGAPLAPRDAAQLAELLARATDFAHQRGIIHRDLKPSNVLFDEAGAPKIADFGLAKRLGDDSERTRTGVVLGTPSYMAPEQAQGRTADATPAVDVYALGAVLYECLTGRPPFRAATVTETMDQVLRQEPAPPTRLQPKTPRDLETICLKCLEKEPRRRYASAAALADDLRRFLDGQPIAARPTPSWERAWKWARRRPAVAALSAAVVLAVVLGFALVTWQWLRADGEWRRAEDKAQIAQKATGLAEQRKGEADDARRRAEEGQANLALAGAQSLCERGEVSRGLLWFARALDLADRAEAPALDRPIRISLADWSGQLSQPRRTMHCGDRLAALEFSPDGKTLLAASKGQVSFWDAASGREDGPPLPHKTFGVLPRIIFSARFSPDGTKVLTGSTDGHARLWNTATRQEISLEAPLTHPHVDVWSAAFIPPDGKRAVTACGDGAARLWDLETGRMIGEPLRHSNNEMFLMALSPDGSELFTVTRDRLVKRWRVPSGEPVGSPLEHESRVTMLLVHPKDGRIVTGTVEGQLRVWTPDGKGGYRPIVLPPPGAAVRPGAISPNGRFLAVATWAGIVRLYDTDSLLPVGATFRHDDELGALAFSPDGAMLAVGEVDGTVHLRSTPVPNGLGDPIHCTGAPVTVAFDRAGDSLLIVEDTKWRVVDLATGRVARRPGPDMGALALDAGALSPDGKIVIEGRWYERTAGFYDARTGEILGATPEHAERVHVLALSPDGATLVTASNGTVAFGHERSWLWNMSPRKALHPLLHGLSVPVSQAAFSPDGRTLLLGCSDHAARFWDPAEDRQVGAPLEHAAPVTAVAFAPDGRMAATGCRDATVRLWDVASRTPLGEPMRCEDEATAVAFSPDGKMLLTAGRGGIARFWDVASGKPLGVPLRHPDAVLSAVYAPDGASVATACADHAARRWRMPPPPLAGDVERIRLWLETLTGMELDDAGAVHDLTSETVEARRHRLDELGGPPPADADR
jgi:WD40 repeat protein